MSQAMIQASVTMNQLQSKLDLIGNNLANSQTNGYKGRESEFASLLYKQINNMTDPANAEGRSTPNGIRVGTGAILGAVNLNMQAGVIVGTGRALDAALVEKNHLFQVQVTENGVAETRYTRDGTFYLSPTPDGSQLMLTTKDGHPVVGANGPIMLQAGFSNIKIGDNGDLIVDRNGAQQVEGNLAVRDIRVPRLLEAAGENLFRLPDLAALGLDEATVLQIVNGNGIIQGGSLEQSNVDMSKEMADLILAQRAYQFNARTISMGDQMMGLVNQLR